jgi:hypothetical protein
LTLKAAHTVNRDVEVHLVAIVCFRDGKLANENIYWDQARSSSRSGLLKDETLPAHGAGIVHKVLEPQDECEVKNSVKKGNPRSAVGAVAWVFR